METIRVNSTAKELITFDKVNGQEWDLLIGKLLETAKTDTPCFRVVKDVWGNEWASFYNTHMFRARPQGGSLKFYFPENTNIAVKREIMSKLLDGICAAGKAGVLKGVYAKTDDLGGDIYEMRFFINGKR